MRISTLTFLPSGTVKCPLWTTTPMSDGSVTGSMPLSTLSRLLLAAMMRVTKQSTTSQRQWRQPSPTSTNLNPQRATRERHCVACATRATLALEAQTSSYRKCYTISKNER
eukprot:m.165197 g.165197  ORF g.165197 m.165197 type:complete len:111 (+) comp17735_c0_seq2:1456-1788(+)